MGRVCKEENMGSLGEGDRLCGMDYLAYMWNARGADFHTGFRLLHNLGVRSIRNWMHFGIFMEDETTFRPDAVRTMHEILAEADRYDMLVIGMCHQNWSLDKKAFVLGKPSRQDPGYEEWLACYEHCWYLTAKEFGEVLYWEIDNEINNKDFMYIEGHFGEKLPTGELAAMSADMLFYASRGIHRGNPGARTVLGGIVDPDGLGIPETDTGTTMVNFMEALYDAIASGEHGSRAPDDFFEIAAWHPYYYRAAPDAYFVRENNRIYEVVRRREGRDKPVFWTEFGWDESLWDSGPIPEAIERLLAVIREQMPYVKCLCYYRYFDDMAEGTPRGMGVYAGLFADPVPGRAETDPKTGRERPAGMPKESACAFQRAAGGSGSLKLFCGEAGEEPA